MPAGAVTDARHDATPVAAAHLSPSVGELDQLPALQPELDLVAVAVAKLNVSALVNGRFEHALRVHALHPDVERRRAACVLVARGARVEVALVAPPRGPAPAAAGAAHL